MHIPFCASLCHYCDFAKTANFNAELVARYFRALQAQLTLWCATLPREVCFSSVYLGGGTPSLFAAEYEPLFAIFAPHLADEVEITLEANPQDVTREKLRAWQALGINRLSLGVQTFNAQHLHFLRRTHTAQQGQDAITQAAEFFAGDVSVDLIYGMPQQSLAELAHDIDMLLASSLTHISLYNLTYESGTPLGRARQRGKLQPLAEVEETQMYVWLCRTLAAHGFEHYEVSNWAQAGKHSRHNANYWQDGGYIGVGAGAHGYLPETEGAGLRYSYHRSERKFSTSIVPSVPQDVRQVPQVSGAIDIDTRDREAWLLEYLASSLRTAAGVDLSRVKIKSGKRLVPSPSLAAALACGQLRIANDVLYLCREEWWRENFWLQQLAAAFVPEQRTS